MIWAALVNTNTHTHADTRANRVCCCSIQTILTLRLGKKGRRKVPHLLIILILKQWKCLLHLFVL